MLCLLSSGTSLSSYTLTLDPAICGSHRQTSNVWIYKVKSEFLHARPHEHYSISHYTGRPTNAVSEHDTKAPSLAAPFPIKTSMSPMAPENSSSARLATNPSPLPTSPYPNKKSPSSTQATGEVTAKSPV